MTTTHTPSTEQVGPTMRPGLVLPNPYPCGGTWTITHVDWQWRERTCVIRWDGTGQVELDGHETSGTLDGSGLRSALRRACVNNGVMTTCEESAYVALVLMGASVQLVPHDGPLVYGPLPQEPASDLRITDGSGSSAPIVSDPTTQTTGWYVLDQYALNLDRAYVSGPWETAAQAREDALSRNISGDLVIRRRS